MSLGGDGVGQLLSARIARLGRLAGHLLDRLALHVDDLAQLTRDVVVHTAEVVALERLAPLTTEIVHHLAQALDAFAVALEPVLHHPPERGVEVTVVEQIVGEFREDVGGIHLEPDLRAVPSGVSDPVATPHAGTVAGRLRRWTASTTNRRSTLLPAGAWP